jgi:hypothetical protein
MINPIGGSFEDVVERGQSAVKNAQKSAQQGAQNFAQTAQQQITGGAPSDHGTSEAGNAASQQQMSDDDAKKFLQDLYGVKSTNSNQQQSTPSQPPVPQKATKTQSQQSVKTALGITKSDTQKVPDTSETIKNALGLPTSEEKGHDSSQTLRTALGLTSEKPEAAQAPAQTIKTAMGISPSQKSPEDEAKIAALEKELHAAYYRELTEPSRQPEETVQEKLEREEQEAKFEEFEKEKKKPSKLPATVKQGTGENVVGVSG